MDMFEENKPVMKRITVNQYVLFIAFMVIFIKAFIIPSFSNFVGANISNQAGTAWITKAEGKPDQELRNATEKIYKLDCW
jgi:hypothetical protein